MRSIERSYTMAGAALVAAGAITALPVVSTPAASHLAGPAARLTSGESLLNVPLNLLQDIVDIPANEIAAMKTMAEALLFSGTWMVGSPTNIWGEDPGDIGHFESVIDMLVPFPELSGADHQSELFYPGLGQEMALLAAVEIPINADCASLDCIPMMPTSPITGFTWIDQTIWTWLIATGIQKFPLIDDWFKVPLSEITEGQGYYFDPSAPGSQDPGVANSGFDWQGTHTGIVDGKEVNLMPWAGQYFKLDLETPFQNFFNSLEQPFDPSKFELPDPVDFARAVQSQLASLIVAFDPFVPGSPLCPGTCLVPDGSGNAGVQSYLLLVEAINDLWRGNKTIEQWLSDYAGGSANISNPTFVDTESWLWRLGQTMFDIGNPMPKDPAIDTSGFLPTMDEVHQWLGNYFFNIADNIGFLGPFDIQGLWDAVFNVADPTPAGEAVTGAGASVATDLDDLATVLDPMYWITGPLGSMFF